MNIVPPAGKTQLVNGSWHYFYRGRMLDLNCSPNGKKPVPRETAETSSRERIEEFMKDTDKRMQQQKLE